MKQLKFLFVLAFATMLSLSCNNDDDSNSDTNDPDLVGTWSYFEVMDDEDFGATVTFNADKSGIIVTEFTYEGETDSETENFTWSSNANKLTLIFSDDTEVVTYSISGNKLTITDDTNTVTVFTKE